MPSTISAGTTAGTAIAIAGDTTGNLAFQTTTNTVMTIDTNQRVGIGTPTPGYKLEVSSTNSALKITTSTATSTNPGIDLLDGSTEAIFSASNSQAAVYVGAYSNHPLVFNTNNAERMRISATGIVTTPAQPAFRATKTNNASVGAGQAIASWDIVNTNIGNNFNSSTGVFTAPVSGMYQLNFSGISNNNSTTALSIQVNGVAVAWTYNFFSQTYSNMSLSVATYMNAGDGARVYITDGVMYGGGDGGAPRFSGFLIG